MSIKRVVAMMAPKAVSDRAISKNNYRGDDWANVSVVLQKMCDMTYKKHIIEFIYGGKVVGWAKPDGTAWCDEEAYAEMRKACKNLPKEERIISFHTHSG